MSLFTFRVEAPCDAERVPGLLNKLKESFPSLELKFEKNVGDELFTLTAYSFSVNDVEDVEPIRQVMIKLIEGDDTYVDMHRTYQTLNEGSEPNEDWFLNKAPAQSSKKITL